MQTITTPEGRTVLLDLDAMTPDQAMMLAQAAATLLARSGMIADGAALSGPHLLQFLDELGEHLAAAPDPAV